MKFVLLSLLIVFFTTTIVVGQLDINFSRNVTGSVSKNDWQFRSTTISSWDLSPLIGCGVFYSSVQAGAANKSANVDSLWGAAKVVTESFPISYLAYWDLNVNFDDSTSWWGLDVSGSAGFIAHSYVSLVEKDPNGNVVATAGLDQGIPIIGKLSYSLTNQGSDPSGLKWTTIAGTSTDGWTIDITFVLSDVVGVVGYGDAYVGPKTLESIINIQNWPYKSSSNTLSLVMGVGTGDVTISGKTLLSKANSANQLYFRASGQATVDGSVQNVDVTYTGTTDFTSYFNDDTIQAQLSSATSGSYSLQIATATFPAGAKNILYDPSVGAGQPVQDESSSATSLVAKSGNVVAVVVAFCVFVVSLM